MLIKADSMGAGDLAADLVIIGAGAAGIAIARKFINTRTSVLVLESGGLEYDAAQQDLYQGAQLSLKGMDLHISRLRYFGGTTNHWEGWCRPLEAEDFAPRNDWPESGWPITRNDLDTYYREAAEVNELGPTGFDDAAFWQKQKGGAALTALPLQTDRLRTSMFQISKPTRFGQRYRQELEAASNIKILLGANVLELLPDKLAKGSAKRMVGLTATTDAGRQIKVTGKQFVLAVGGIETPRVLLSSTQMFANGAGNEHDLVGRYFQDHPWLPNVATIKFTSAPKVPVNLPLYFDQTDIAGAKVFGTLTPNPAKAIDAGIGGFRIWLQPTTVSTQGMDSLRQTYAEISAGKVPDRLAEHVGNVLEDWDVIVNNIYKTALNTKKDWLDVGSGKILGAIADINYEQRPRFDSRVTLGKAVDRFGIRRVELDWRMGDEERRTAMTAMQWMAEAFGQMGMGRTRITLDLQKDKPWPKSLWGSCHHMGTARMAATPEKGVVNADCRVHSVENLYIAGSAVFPTSGYANPTLTIVALALRLADHLKTKLA